MWKFLRISCACCLGLVGCSSNPAADARRETAAVSALAKPGVSADSVRAELIARGYACADGSGRFLTETGTIATAPRYISCSKNVGGTLVCAYRMDVIVVARGEAADVHVRSGEICL